MSINVTVGLLMTSTAFMPKRYRLTHGLPAIRSARAVVYDINRADAFYPNTEANVGKRKEWLTLAVADCEQLCIDLTTYLRVREAQQQMAVDNGAPTPKIGGKGLIAQVIGDADREIGLIKGARKRVRLVTRNAVE